MTFIEAMGVASMLVGFVISVAAYMVADQANRSAARSRLEVGLLLQRLGRDGHQERNHIPRWDDEWIDQAIADEFNKGERLCKPVTPRP